MQALLDWLVALPPVALYAVLALTAGVENVFPPFPSDVVVAFGSFVAAQGHKAVVGVFVATWVGNVTGAMLVYALARKYGAQRLERRLAGRHARSADVRVRRLFERFGMAAIFVSRFVPGVRAVVPAFAGALRLPPLGTAAMIGAASALWYGLITVTAYRVGQDWTQLRAAVTRLTSDVALVATVVFIVTLGAWFLLRRRQRLP